METLLFHFVIIYQASYLSIYLSDVTDFSMRIMEALIGQFN